MGAVDCCTNDRNRVTDQNDNRVKQLASDNIPSGGPEKLKEDDHRVSVLNDKIKEAKADNEINLQTFLKSYETELHGLDSCESWFYVNDPAFNSDAVYKGSMGISSDPYCREGFGAVLSTNGDFYIGQCKGNNAHGTGLFMHKNMYWCLGNFVENRMEGSGMIKTIGTSRYEGQVLNGQKHGKGEERFDDWSSYVGDYVYDQKTGDGKFNFADGSGYDGQFDKDNMHGYGTYKWADGKIYEGYWQLGLMHTSDDDESTFTWADQRKYVGQYKFDKKEGYGKFTFKNGMVYRGNWFNGRQHGSGWMIKLVNGEVKQETAGYWTGGQKLTGQVHNSRYSRESQPDKSLNDLYLLWKSGATNTTCGGSYILNNKEKIIHNGQQYHEKAYFSSEKWDLKAYQWTGTVTLTEHIVVMSKNENYATEIVLTFSEDWQRIIRYKTTVTTIDGIKKETVEEEKKPQKIYIMQLVGTETKIY